jgi:hypothetical protein
MRTWIVMVVFFLVVVGPAWAAPQAEEVVDDATTASQSPAPPPVPAPLHAPAWLQLVRVAATTGPIAFLVLAWLIGGIVHWRLVRREQAQFPAHRGSRTPQTVPMIVSAALFLIPAILFIVFEVRSRVEIHRGIGGVVDEWQPVTAHAWTALFICLVLAVVPWLLARPADTVA